MDFFLWLPSIYRETRFWRFAFFPFLVLQVDIGAVTQTIYYYNKSRLHGSNQEEFFRI